MWKSIQVSFTGRGSDSSERATSDRLATTRQYKDKETYRNWSSKDQLLKNRNQDPLSKETERLQAILSAYTATKVALKIRSVSESSGNHGEVPNTIGQARFAGDSPKSCNRKLGRRDSDRVPLISKLPLLPWVALECIDLTALLIDAAEAMDNFEASPLATPAAA